MSAYIKNGNAVYARFDPSYKAVYTTVETHAKKVDYLFIKPENEATEAWRAALEGYLPCELGNEKPELADGEYLGYKMLRGDGVITKSYMKIGALEELPDDELMPRLLSKYSIVSYLIGKGVWETVKAKIVEKGLLDLFESATVFDESNPYFSSSIGELQELLGWTDEDVSEMFSSCIAK